MERRIQDPLPATSSPHCSGSTLLLLWTGCKLWSYVNNNCAANFGHGLWPIGQTLAYSNTPTQNAQCYNASTTTYISEHWEPTHSPSVQQCLIFCTDIRPEISHYEPLLLWGRGMSPFHMLWFLVIALALSIKLLGLLHTGLSVSPENTKLQRFSKRFFHHQAFGTDAAIIPTGWLRDVHVFFVSL